MPAIPPPPAPVATGPNSQNDVQDRHAREQKALRSQLQFWSNVLGAISGALGFAALFLTCLLRIRTGRGDREVIVDHATFDSYEIGDRFPRP